VVRNAKVVLVELSLSSPTSRVSNDRCPGLSDLMLGSAHRQIISKIASQVHLVGAAASKDRRCSVAALALPSMRCSGFTISGARCRTAADFRLAALVGCTGGGDSRSGMRRSAAPYARAVARTGFGR